MQLYIPSNISIQLKIFRIEIIGQKKRTLTKNISVLF